jgi:hypothetical protein
VRNPFGGRRWQVVVQTAAAARQVGAVEKEKRKAEAGEARKSDASRKVYEALEGLPEGETTKGVAEAAGLQPRVVGPS